MSITGPMFQACYVGSTSSFAKILVVPFDAKSEKVKNGILFANDLLIPEACQTVVINGFRFKWDQAKEQLYAANATMTTLLAMYRAQHVDEDAAIQYNIKLLRKLFSKSGFQNYKFVKVEGMIKLTL